MWVCSRYPSVARGTTGRELPLWARHRWAALSFDRLTALEPGRGLQHLDRAGGVERQAGEGFDPGGDALRVVGQLRRRPEPHHAVHAPGEEGLAVAAVRHGRDRRLMRQALADPLASGGVPELRRAVVARGEDGLAVGAEGPSLDRTGLLQG